MEAQNQGYVLAHPNICPSCDLMEYGGGGASIMIPGSTLLARISLVLTHGTPRL